MATATLNHFESALNALVRSGRRESTRRIKRRLISENSDIFVSFLILEKNVCSFFFFLHDVVQLKTSDSSICRFFIFHLYIYIDLHISGSFFFFN